jgi:hypothetical protein
MIKKSGFTQYQTVDLRRGRWEASLAKEKFGKEIRSTKLVEWHYNPAF